MKKLFTLFLALFMMAFCAKAQITDDFESYTAFTVDPTGTWTYYDGDLDTTYSFSDLTFTNQNYIGSCIVFNPSQTDPTSDSLFAAHSGSQYIAFFSAMHRENNDWMISPALPANGCTLSFYARELTTTYGDEIMNIMYSTTNNAPSSFTLLQTISVSHSEWAQYTCYIPANATYLAFNYVSEDVFALFIDDIAINPVPAEAAIYVTPTTIDFGTVNMPAIGSAIANITAYHLTTGITAQTSAPFSVSADGNTYDSTATIAEIGGTLYVKYEPTVAGIDNGSITLTSGSATESIILTGNAVDCGSLTLPIFESFESGDCPATCWTIEYGDGVGTANPMTHNSATATEGDQSFRFSSYNSTSDYTQYLITPPMPAGDKILLFDYAAYNSSVETFHVGYSTTGNDINDFTWGDTIFVSNVDGWQTYSDVIPANVAYIAIKYTSYYKYYLYIDNFNVLEIAEALMVNPTIMDFAGTTGTPTEAQDASLTGIALTEDIIISTEAPFEVSTDGGNNFGLTDTITYSVGSTITNGDFQVRYNPTNEGVQTGIVVLTSGNVSDTIYLSGDAMDCSAGISIPYLNDFNTGLYSLRCWTVVDEENYSSIEMDEDDLAITIGAVDRLITPMINATEAMLLAFDFSSEVGESAPTKFRVGFSSTDMAETSFTFLEEVTAGAEPDTYTTIIPANAKYVAIDVTRVGLYTYIFWSVPNSLYIDNFSLTTIEEPMIMVTPTELNMGRIPVGTQSVKTINVLAAQLSDNITVSAPADFKVSSDNGSTYGTSATLPAEGGNLLVKYEPTTAGSNSGTITLASGTFTININVNGKADDCSAPEDIPFAEDFEEELTACWLNIDNDNDGHTWMSTMDFAEAELPGFTGNASYISESYSNSDGALTPDNWLISPAINIPSTGAKLSWWVTSANSNYAAEHYDVKISTSGNDLADFTTVYNETLNNASWHQRVVDLNSYAGQTIHVAFVHNNCSDMLLLMLDAIYIGEGVGIDEAEQHFASVYPNPANNVINVNATSNINHVEVYTIAGQKVGDFSANGAQAVISTSNLTNGMYLMRINTENGVINKKFSVVR